MADIRLARCPGADRAGGVTDQPDLKKPGTCHVTPEFFVEMGDGVPANRFLLKW